MKRWSAAIIAFTCFGIVIGSSMHGLPALGETGWVSLFDGRNLDNWTTIGDANWTVADGLLQADKGSQSYLVSKNNYSDFPTAGGVLGQRRCQQRHLHPLHRSNQDQRQECL